MPGAGDAQSLVQQLNAKNSNVAVIAAMHGNVIFGGEQRSPAEQVLDFGALLQEATRFFVGRREVFAGIEAFRAAHPCGYFEVVADAGLGKTALAAEIARRCDAVVFFASASRGLTRPAQLLMHLSAALVTRHALPYDHLPARAGEDSTFLNRILAEAAAKAGGPVWIVVDALDEAEPSPAGANRLLLPTHLPSGVYVVVTQRPPGRLLTQPGTPRVRIELRADARQQQADIEEYLTLRASSEGRIKSALARSRPPITPAAFIQRLLAASRGNFMYLSYVLGDIEGQDVESRPLDLEHLPDGLQGYYEQFWSDMEQAKTQGWADWKSLYRPTIERLAVAFESVSAEWIGSQIGRDPDEVRERALQPWARLLSAERVAGNETWRLVHRSFADFLQGKLDLAAAHRAVADRYAGPWSEKHEIDDYGLRHTPMHLAAAARAEQDAGRRHDLTAKLASLLLDAGYQQQYLTRLRDPSGFERALEAALRSVAQDAQATPLDTATIALRLVAFRKEQRQPQPVFDLARRGEIEAAERRLDLFALDVDAAWYDALLLTIAWLGSPREPGKARALRDRVRKHAATAPASATLALLLARVDAALDAAPMPALSLRPPPTPPEAQAIMLRLDASAADRELLGASIELMNRGEPVAGDTGYLAERDGPSLVSLAVHVPDVGEPLLKRYVALHAGYGYREYRQGSLWALLGAVLQHPSQEWVQAWVSALGAAVLAPNRGEFREALLLAGLALQVHADEAGAADALERRRTDAIAASQKPADLPAGLAIDPARNGDTWGSHRRRLAALAEALACIPGKEAAAQDALLRALALPPGFAGFNAPACMALAEAIEIAGGGAVPASQALAAARASAHNIQDATFCVRSTARVQALRQRWWEGPAVAMSGAAEAAGRLAEDASTPEFAALHVIGEKYEDRSRDTSMPLPAEVFALDTLAQLASAFQRPLDDFQRLNGDRHWEAGQAIAQGTPVNVPDPGLPPLLAARLAGKVLSDAGLSPQQKEAVIRGLVPVAAADATALDSVLARLVLASRCGDRAMLAALVALASQVEAEAPPDTALTAHLTAFVP